MTYGTTTYYERSVIFFSLSVSVPHPRPLSWPSQLAPGLPAGPRALPAGFKALLTDSSFFTIVHPNILTFVGPNVCLLPAPRALVLGGLQATSGGLRQLQKRLGGLDNRLKSLKGLKDPESSSRVPKRRMRGLERMGNRPQKL